MESKFKTEGNSNSLGMSFSLKGSDAGLLICQAFILVRGEAWENKRTYGRGVMDICVRRTADKRQISLTLSTQQPVLVPHAKQDLPTALFGILPGACFGTPATLLSTCLYIF